MASLRSQILDHLKGLLEAAGKPAGLTVDLLRLGNLETVDLPHALIRPTGEDVELANPDSLRCPVVVRDLKVAVDCRATATAGQTIEDALDALLVWVTKAILANPRLGGLAIHTEENGTDWSGEETADGTQALATVSFTVRYRTKTQDQEAKA